MAGLEDEQNDLMKKFPNPQSDEGHNLAYRFTGARVCEGWWDFVLAGMKFAPFAPTSGPKKTTIVHLTLPLRPPVTSNLQFPNRERRGSLLLSLRPGGSNSIQRRRAPEEILHLRRRQGKDDAL